MMTVQMNSVPDPSSRELAESLHQKNMELEKSLRKSAQSKVPSNPSTWLEMRENFERIILVDYDFAQKQETETALWQLHYRRIEEFRAHIKSASNPSSQNTTNANANAERVKRIKSSFKNFLSEATGYYHELMLKIRSNYGLPLGYFSEGPECKIDPVKDEKREKEMKKGLLSCHRCLIYLGDLARYKGLYGDADSVEREFYNAANGYYLQAVFLYPSSGNPHHQLGLLANYSHNELLLVYRYFRSLAVEFPFSMARENLVVAFEKNRQSYIQLASNSVVAKAGNSKVGPPRPAGKYRGGKGDNNRSSNKESKKEIEISLTEILKNFCVRFVRLNGILFTKTSLETFDEVFSSLMTDFQTLLSSGSEEQLNFGPNYNENALLILRLISMLIYTIHNSKRDSENQSYAEIVQRTLILKNAFKFSFEFVGNIMKRCVEVKEIGSSFYLNGILVYLEWLASHSDIALGTSGTGSEMDEMQFNARFFFWNQFVHLMNKLVRTGLASFEGDNDVSCFFEMSNYEEGETGNRLALWEDFELRGFIPLVPAQVILDFSRKSEGGLKERKFRVERIFAATRSLMNIIQIGPNKIYFDQGDKKFVICKEAPEFPPPLQISPRIVPNGVIKANMPNLESFDSDEDEVIVFQPHTDKIALNSTANIVPTPSEDDFVAQKFVPNPNSNNFTEHKFVPNPNADNFMDQNFVPKFVPNPNANDFIDRNIQISSAGWMSPVTAPITNSSQLQSSNILDNSLDLRNSSAQIPPSNNLDYVALLSTGLHNFAMAENQILEQRNNFTIGENKLPFPSNIPSPPSPQLGFNNDNMISNGFMNQSPFSSSMMSAMPSVLDFGAPNEGGLGTRFMDRLPVSKEKPNPVSRPVRHMGPPPGFNIAVNGPPPGFNTAPNPIKRPDEMLNYPNNEYGYLNQYQPVPNHGMNTNHLGYNNYMNFGSGNGIGSGTGMDMFGGTSFGYPSSSVPVSGTQNVGVKDFQLFEPSGNNVNNSNNNINMNGQQEDLQNSIWSGRFFV